MRFPDLAASRVPLTARSFFVCGSLLILAGVNSAASAATLTVPFTLDGSMPTLMIGQSTPLDQTVSGVTAHFSSPNDGTVGAFSVQNSFSTGFRLSMFTGNYLYANTNFHYPLDIKFSRQIASVTLTFATTDYLASSDIPADLKLTAYLGTTAGTPVGSVTRHADYGSDTYPSSTITFSAGGAPFDLIELIIPPNAAGTNAFLVDNVVAVASAPTGPFTFTVTTTADTPDAHPGDGMAADASGATSLRAALMECNASGVGGNTIILPEGRCVLTLGALDAACGVRLLGAGANRSVVDGNRFGRVLHIQAGAKVTLDGLAMTGGQPTGAPDHGGGIENYGALVATDCTFSSNTATTDGGALFNESAATASFTRCSLWGNQASGMGGAVCNAGGSTVTLTACTLSGNMAGGAGGAIYANGVGATTILLCDTIGANLGAVNHTGSGGGVATSGGTVSMTNTIVAGNSDGGAGAPDCFGTILSGGYNLIQDASHCTIAGDPTGNITGVDPKLAPLGTYGGATLTQALCDGSPAIDAGGNAGALLLDQRGCPRVADGDGDYVSRVDIGAFEYRSQRNAIRAWTLLE